MISILAQKNCPFFSYIKYSFIQRWTFNPNILKSEFLGFLNFKGLKNWLKIFQKLFLSRTYVVSFEKFRHVSYLPSPLIPEYLSNQVRGPSRS